MDDASEYSSQYPRGGGSLSERDACGVAWGFTVRMGCVGRAALSLTDGMTQRARTPLIRRGERKRLSGSGGRTRTRTPGAETEGEAHCLVSLAFAYIASGSARNSVSARSIIWPGARSGTASLMQNKPPNDVMHQLPPVPCPVSISALLSSAGPRYQGAGGSLLLLDGRQPRQDSALRGGIARDSA